jgi:hypothetical protein
MHIEKFIFNVMLVAAITVSSAVLTDTFLPKSKNVIAQTTASVSTPSVPKSKDTLGVEVVLSESEGLYSGIISLDATIVQSGKVFIQGNPQEVELVKAAWNMVAKDPEWGRYLHLVKRIRIADKIKSFGTDYGGFAKDRHDLVTLRPSYSNFSAEDNLLILATALGHESWHLAGYNHAQMTDAQRRFTASYGKPWLSVL